MLPLIRQRELLFLVCGVKPQHSLRECWKTMNNICDLERPELDIAQDRILDRRLQSSNEIGTSIVGKIGEIELVRFGETQQGLCCHWSLIALHQSNVRWRDIQISRHLGLRQAQVPSKAAKAWPEINTLLFHKNITALQIILVKLYSVTPLPLALRNFSI